METEQSPEQKQLELSCFSNHGARTMLDLVESLTPARKLLLELRKKAADMPEGSEKNWALFRGENALVKYEEFVMWMQQLVFVTDPKTRIEKIDV